MGCDIRVAGFKSRTTSVGGSFSSFGGPIATVFEEPSIDASDVKINHTGSQGLMIWGTGFNDMVPPVMDFDPPLDSANLHVNVGSFKRVPERNFSRVWSNSAAMTVVLYCQPHVFILILGLFMSFFHVHEPCSGCCYAHYCAR